MGANRGKCLGPNNNGISNGTLLVVQDCNGTVTQTYTAALDTQSEYDVYLRFHELTQGKATLLISHRFSTVRMADRIVVLQHGRVTEEGDHGALVARGGLYAELFEMQAVGYR